VANGTAMKASVRAELGVLDDAALADARIIDYFNEGQALMLPDVTFTASTVLSILAAATQTATPASFVRVTRIMPDPNTSGSRVPPYLLVDGQFVWLDTASGRAATSVLLVYERKFAAIADTGTAIEIPDPGPEGLIAFACFRWTQRLVGDRAAYKRYATQTGTNVVDVDDIQTLSEMWHQRYLQCRDMLATRTRIAIAGDIARV